MRTGLRRPRASLARACARPGATLARHRTSTDVTPANKNSKLNVKRRKTSSPKSSSSAASVDPQKEFIVERIIDKRVRNGKAEYYLKWEGYAESFNTWEPRECVLDNELVEDFERKYAKRQALLPVKTAETVETTGFDRGLVGERVLGVMKNDRNEILCLVKWKNHTGAELIRSSIVSKQCPQLVIDYYQSHVFWKRKH